MELSESPIETLILSYTSFDFQTKVSSLWTWIAVLTAAVSLWRFKAAATTQSRRKSYHLQTPLSDDDGFRLKTETQDGFCVTSEIHDGFSLKSHFPSTLTALEVTERTQEENQFGSLTEGETGYYDGRCKGKFTARFEFDGDGGTELPEIESWVDGKVDAVKMICSVGEVDGKREMTVVTPPRLEWSWYCHVDLTVLNGSVVRFWDGDDREEVPEEDTFRWVS